jgi:hypothetical protein
MARDRTEDAAVSETVSPTAGWISFPIRPSFIETNGPGHLSHHGTNWVLNLGRVEEGTKLPTIGIAGGNAGGGTAYWGAITQQHLDAAIHAVTVSPFPILMGMPVGPMIGQLDPAIDITLGTGQRGEHSATFVLDSMTWGNGSQHVLGSFGQAQHLTIAYDVVR